MKFGEMQGAIKEDFGGMLDNRGVGGSEFHTNQILKAIKSIHTPIVASPNMSQDEGGISHIVISDEEKEVESESNFSLDHIDDNSEIG